MPIWSQVPKPRGRVPTHGDATSKSITFFGHIGTMKLADYRKKVEEASDVSYKEDFVSQVHVCSDLACQQFDHFKTSVILSGIGVGRLALSYWLHLLWTTWKASRGV